MNRKERIDLLVMVIGFCLIGYAFDHHIIIWVVLSVGAVSFIIPPIGKRVNWLWLKISEAIGFVMSRVLLTLVFFVVLFPVAMIYQISKKDTLKLRKQPGESMFVNRDHQYVAEDLENPW